MKNEVLREVCEVCGEGHLSHVQDMVTAEYKGKSAQVPTLYSVCDACGSDYATATDLRANKRARIAFEKSVEGLLSGEAIRAIRRKLCLSQEQAAKMFGGGPVAFSKYEVNDVAHSASMDKLLRAADEVPEMVVWLAKRAGLAMSALPLQRGRAAIAAKPELVVHKPVVPQYVMVRTKFDWGATNTVCDVPQKPFDVLYAEEALVRAVGQVVLIDGSGKLSEAGATVVLSEYEFGGHGHNRYRKVERRRSKMMQ